MTSRSPDDPEDLRPTHRGGCVAAHFSWGETRRRSLQLGASRPARHDRLNRKHRHAMATRYAAARGTDVRVLPPMSGPISCSTRPRSSHCRPSRRSHPRSGEPRRGGHQASSRSHRQRLLWRWSWQKEAVSPRRATRRSKERRRLDPPAKPVSPNWVIDAAARTGGNPSFARVTTRDNRVYKAGSTRKTPMHPRGSTPTCGAVRFRPVQSWRGWERQPCRRKVRSGLHRRRL